MSMMRHGRAFCEPDEPAYPRAQSNSIQKRHHTAPNPISHTNNLVRASSTLHHPPHQPSYITTSTTTRPLIEPGDPIPRPKRRYRPHDPSKRTPRQVEDSRETILQKLPIAQVIRDVCRELVEEGMEIRWQSRALMCLQEAAEAHLVHVFEESKLRALCVRRVTVTAEDMRLARRIRKVGRPRKEV